MQTHTIVTRTNIISTNRWNELTIHKGPSMYNVGTVVSVSPLWRSYPYTNTIEDSLFIGISLLVVFSAGRFKCVAMYTHTRAYKEMSAACVWASHTCRTVQVYAVWGVWIETQLAWMFFNKTCANGEHIECMRFNTHMSCIIIKCVQRLFMP